MKKEDLFKKNHLLGIEFDRHVLENPGFLQKMTDGTEIIFLPEDDRELCEENMKIAQAHRDAGKPLTNNKLPCCKETGQKQGEIWNRSKLRGIKPTVWD